MFFNLRSLPFKNLDYICSPFAGVVELVDTLDLGLSQAKGKKNFEMRAWWNW
jgi:hypothetical protein